MELLRLMFTRRWLLATAIVVSAIAIFVRLGIWQLDRLEERREINMLIADVLNNEPLRLPDAVPPNDPDLLRDRDAIASGTYDFENQRLLILQTWGGRNGVNLITPLVLDGGETAVLIDRGWVPDAEADLQTIAEKYNTPSAETVTGYVALTETLTRQSGGGTAVRPENEIYRVDVAAIGAELPYELLDFYVVQAPLENDLDAFPYRKTKVVDLSEGSHLSYAIQWFLFALVLIVLYPIFIRRRSMQ